jgi:hypothetical protein
MTIFGRVYMETGSAAAETLQKISDKGEVESITIESKRSHEYKPEFIKK